MLNKADELDVACHEREQECDEYASTVATLEERIAALESALESARLSTQDILEEERQVSDGLRGRLQTLEREMKILSSKNDEMKTELDAKSKESFMQSQDEQTKMEDSLRQLKAVKEENTTLRESLREKVAATQIELEKESRARLQVERQLSQARLDYEALQNFSKDYREVKQKLDEKTKKEKVPTAWPLV
eukprot:TRINITY_DN1308_c0_g1_i1.p1 TRINITY_DN1308_c0_g1~~TRINITY_DN1308_c0_g1_i1.p1  ORF type:complete len:217 (+),score=36.29 TRINITY_DN1308_c0_g1_i1:80-652(+)